MFIVNTEAAIFRDGKYLIIKRGEKEAHAGGELSLVGGKVEIEGDSTDVLENTIIREVKEEVGLSIIGKPRYIQSTNFVTDNGFHVVNVIFLCEEVEGDAYAASADEVNGVYWLTPEEVYMHAKAPDYLKDSVERAEALRTER
ncbi:NUDIX domain-containing protein [Sporosarcina sp. Marseille-Q4063]|uniref:NUDIX hydrolase n=1 Tax=Sporosarcina sp. Marseille-Q4063 TaxID=2810514 RepID=UPI001BAF0CA8|nr:NUDIX domain-containing protein [Sporosarcina sp. Marseille-Q4063]QUW20446.1 NUDIX domain-containing protein [Sporosarcina sp. Marseille-Q4063]